MTRQWVDVDTKLKEIEHLKIKDMNELKVMQWRINCKVENTTELPYGWEYRLHQIKQHLMMVGTDILGLYFEDKDASDGK